MFRSFIYLDTDKMYTYKRQIDGSCKQSTAMTQKHSAGLAATIKNISLNAATETNITHEFINDISIDYDHFEIDLTAMDGSDYFDCAVSDYDMLTIPAMKIIRLCNGFTIPEAFDVVNLIDIFKPMLMGGIETSSSGERAALESILGKASADIPILIECDDITVSGKLNAKYLLEEYASLEEYADQDVYLLCKVVGVARKDNVVFFDPLKDFIRLPRMARRQMEQDGESMGMEKISVPGPILKVEIIAIYK